MKKKERRRFSGLDFSGGSLICYPAITLDGNRSAAFSGCAGVCEYAQDRITLAVGGLPVTVRGSGLEIVSMGESETVISGRFSALIFDAEG